MIFKNYPLAYHAFAKKAAIAAAAAQKQGRFWEYHDRLFENYERLDDQKFREIARELNLDLEKFEKDMNDPATILRVDKDYQLGRSVGVGGTPTDIYKRQHLKGQNTGRIPGDCRRQPSKSPKKRISKRGPDAIRNCRCQALKNISPVLFGNYLKSL